ncbi:MAG TPA: hypothetical protein VFB38_10555 [Chthonomonadaceae bacterium]|nr:hypothetical protein [Chthonomonadaceae bacterium]
MRKPDEEVKEVICSETGKPMPKIPLWMAGMKVKFVSDEARQKHPSAVGIPDVEPIRRSLVSADDVEELKDFEVVGNAIDPEGDFDDIDLEGDEVLEEEFEG